MNITNNIKAIAQKVINAIIQGAQTTAMIMRNQGLLQLKDKELYPEKYGKIIL